MSPRTVPAFSPSLFSWPADQIQYPYAALTPDFQDLYSRGMDQALGMEKASLDAAVQLQSQALDIYSNAFGGTPALRNLFDSTAQFLTSCMELQMFCLSLMLPGMAATPGSGRQSQPATEELESSMDIGIGQPRTGAHARLPMLA